MNTPQSIHPARQTRMPAVRSALAVGLFAFLASAAAFGQAAPNATETAALAKYDLNRNGRLDPEEEAARRADEQRARAAV
ncbi:MAG: hypothetical protein FJ399_17130, partial [Verrucomicrobia bacterium]|nr:hypothetical protein [Verrucomicrobiota bacterium]